MPETAPTEKVVRKARRAWRRVKLALAAVLAVLVLIVLFQNYRAQTTVSALFWELEVRLYVPLLVALGIGAVMGLIICHVLRNKEH
jgi:uncharacterized integral membrane protein